MTVSTAPRAGDLGLAHAVADHLAAAELDLFAIGGQVALDLDEKIRIRQAAPGRPWSGPNMCGIARAGN